MLDGSHVAAITGQLNELLASLQKVKDQSKSNDSNKDDSEHKTKVSEALETASSIAPFLTVIPDVVSWNSDKVIHECMVVCVCVCSGQQVAFFERST